MNNNTLRLANASDSVQINSSHWTGKASDSRDELVRTAQSQNPSLEAEDVFVVPPWFAQQKQWFEDSTGSNSAVYNYPLLLRIRGPVNEYAMQKSLQEIVHRHGPLRSVFRMIDNKLCQVVLTPRMFTLPVTEVGGPPKAKKLQIELIARTEAMQPFDLSRGPLLRGKLMRLEKDDYVLQLTTHTLVYDDWSTGVLIRELSELYGAFATGIMPPTRELPFQFGDFARWQLERLQGEEAKSHVAYWKSQLDVGAGFDHLPTDFARPYQYPHTGATRTAILPAAQADSLKALSRQERVSLFMVLLAAFKCLLYRYSGDEEIGVGSCAANRALEEIEGLIGRFGNTVLLRTSLSGNPTFSELLKRVREVTLKAWSHQEIPFGMLLDGSNGWAARHQEPLFRVMFNLQNAPKESWQLPGLNVEWFPLETGTSKLDLIVWLKTDPGLEITLEYSSELFKTETINRILADYQALLNTLLKDPKARIDNSPILSRPEPDGANVAALTANRTVGVGDMAAVEARMVELWRNVFGPRPIDVTQNFFELGGDSLLAVRLFAQINKTFHRTLPLTLLLDAPTIRQLVQILCDQPACASSSLVSVQPNGTRPPFFCVHGGGGEPYPCWKLSSCLGPDQPVYGLRSQGIYGGPIQHTVSEMATHYTQIIRAVQPSGPYYLGGFCFGGMVAYEMARILTARGENVALVALFNSPAPGSIAVGPLNINYLKWKIPHDLKTLASEGTEDKFRFFSAKSIWLARKALQYYSWAFCSLFERDSATRMVIGRRELANVVWDANVAAAEAYQPGPYAGRVAFYWTREYTSHWTTDPRKSWLQFASGQIEQHIVEGDHTCLFQAPFVAPLAEKLRLCMELSRDQVHSSPSVHR